MPNLVTDFSNNSIPPLTLSAIALAVSVSALSVLLRQKHMPHKLFLIGMQLFNVIYEISLAACSAIFFLVYLQRQAWQDDPFYFYAIRLVPDILSGFLIYLLLMFDVNLLEVFSVLDETRLTKKVLGLLRVAFTGLFVCLHGWAITQSIYNMVENMGVNDNPVAIFLRNVSNTTSLIFFAIAMVWDNCQYAYLISKIWDFNKYKSKKIPQEEYHEATGDEEAQETEMGTRKLENSQLDTRRV